MHGVRGLPQPRLQKGVDHHGDCREESKNVACGRAGCSGTMAYHFKGTKSGWDELQRQEKARHAGAAAAAAAKAAKEPLEGESATEKPTAGEHDPPSGVDLGLGVAPPAPAHPEGGVHVPSDAGAVLPGDGAEPEPQAASFAAAAWPPGVLLKDRLLVISRCVS